MLKGYYDKLICPLICVKQDKLNQLKEIISQKPNKVICLDKLFADNDQLRTNTVLQMKDTGMEFKTV